MSEAPRNYSALSAEEQSAVSVWIDSFEASYEYEGAAALKKAVLAAPDELRPALVTQLLPALIDHDRQRQGRTPTLHELRARFPDLAGDLSAAYPLLPDAYRLPVELRGYRVLRVVGEGGQAVVLRAQDDVHSAVAIKLSASPQHNELLLRERELLGQCQHPGIPEVIASGVEQDRAFFIMPFLRGMTLADKYSSHRPEPAEAARIVAELCDITSHLHARGILHRDIKPQNIWIDDSGAVKLIDLGMAIDRSSWGSPRAAVEEFHGTPAFMSPEQAASDGGNDGELSDVFSIGAVLYWMGTGAAPFEGSDGQSVLSKAAAGSYDRDRLQVLAGWPKRLTNTCLRAMATDPTERLPSAKSLAEQLRQVADSPPRSERRLIRKAAAALAGLLLALLVGVLFYPDVASSWLSDATLETAIAADIEAGKSSLPIEEPEEPTWIERVATANAIDLSAITGEDIEVSGNCVVRLIQPWGDQPRGPEARPELKIELNPKLKPLADALQWRVGALGWNSITATANDATYTARLNPLAAGDHGPVEVRFVSDPGSSSDTAVGPLQLDFDVARALQEDEQAFGRELIKEATTEKCFDVELPGWRVREEYSRRIGPIIGEFWFGETKDGELTPVLASLSKMVDPERGGGRPNYDLRQAFALLSRDVQEKNKLWIKIRFAGGGIWGPVLYEKPLTESQRQRERVMDWFGKLDSKDELVKFEKSNLLLTRLNEVVPDLTHLHIVGRWYDFESNKDQSEGVGNNNASGGMQMLASTEVVVKLSDLSGDRTIKLPSIWNKVSIRGRLPDGSFTPEFEAENGDVSCGTAIAPISASSQPFKTELYLSIETRRHSDRETSVVPYLKDKSDLKGALLREAEKSQLILTSLLPDSAARVEHYADRGFNRRIHTAAPGAVYARYVGPKDETLGYAFYQLTEKLILEWADHAHSHAWGKVNN